MGGLWASKWMFFRFDSPQIKRVLAGYIIITMIKICLVALLLSLTCQLTLDTHFDSPLQDKLYLISANSLNIANINGAIVSFSSSTVYFFNKAHYNSAGYTISPPSITVSANWTVSRGIFQNDFDTQIRSFFTNSVKYTIDAQGKVTLTDKTRKWTLVLAPK